MKPIPVTPEARVLSRLSKEPRTLDDFARASEMSRPKRIQRRRTKGWRMPVGAVYIGRPSSWGNSISAGDRLLPVRVGDVVDAPFVWHVDSAAAAVNNGVVRITPTIAVDLFRFEVLGWNHDYRMRWLEPLRGRDLVCWCPLDQPCHADVLLELLA